jgi:hypothetical protein
VVAKISNQLAPLRDFCFASMPTTTKIEHFYQHHQKILVHQQQQKDFNYVNSSSKKFQLSQQQFKNILALPTTTTKLNFTSTTKRFQLYK